MRFSFGQEQRQEQSQVMTQRMIQSMEILQLSAQQLEARINEELEKNPVLELAADLSHALDSGIIPPENASDSSADNSDSRIESPSGIINPAEDSSILLPYEREPELFFDNDASGTQEEFQTAADFAQNYDDTIDEMPVRSQNWLEDQDDRRNDAFANTASPPQSLQSYLSEQLGLLNLSPEMQEMTQRIIFNLDVNGYFSSDLDRFLGEQPIEESVEIEEDGEIKLKTKIKTIHRQYTEEEKALAVQALELVRTLDPPGVGAKDLKDCLLLQIDPENPLADLLQQLIQSHLEDISDNRIPLIAKQTNCPLEMVQEAIAELKHLNPRPCAGYESETELYKVGKMVVPDVIVEKNDAGRYIVRLDDRSQRRLSVNPYYEKMRKNRDTDMDKKASKYIAENVGSARWLIDAIEQRRATLLKVSEAIVDYQTDFFESGQHALKPLKMQQIADKVGVHITTVSRACNEKWMLTPQGVFPFSRFFTGTIASSGALHPVQLKLKEIIDKEDKNAPYSDDVLVNMLADNGFQIARRTVVKYRDQMNIPSSGKRKVWKK